MNTAFLLLGSYLVGSIPFGVIVGRLARGIDIRKYGSGNIGFSNVLRVLGPGAAAVVLAGDTLKGLLPVLVGRRLLAAWHVTDVDLALLAVGFAPILGHSFSVFLHFRGGRAVTTTGGVLLGLCWPGAVAGVAVWLALVGATRYISLGSIGAAISVPVYMVAAGKRWEWDLFWALVAALVILRHLPNIGRLLAGEETKIGEKVQVGGAGGGESDGK
jgi:glycerol-3-phosphate acyltransferase PlsY